MNPALLRKTTAAMAALILLSQPIWAGTMAAPLSLHLKQAMALAAQRHARALDAEEQVNEAQALATEARAAFGPMLGFQTSQLRQTENLKAMGISIPGVPYLIGPFDTFDARLLWSQRIFDLARRRDVDAARHGLQATRLNAQATAQQIAGAAGLAYLVASEAQALVEAAQANEKLAQQLLTLTIDQQKAGLATGVDRVRAESAEANARYQLTQAEGMAQDADTRLHRALALPMTLPVVVADSLTLDPAPLAPLPQAVQGALAHRPELLALKEALEQRNAERQAASDEGLPSVSLVGNIGPSGMTPTQYDYRTFAIGVQLNLPIAQGGAMNARIDAAESRHRQASLELIDSERQVEEDVRLSHTAVTTSRAQSEAAQRRLELGQRLLDQARDRFQNGVADNLELFDAQAALAQAKSDLINALGATEMAEINDQLAQGVLDYDAQPPVIPEIHP